MQEIDIHEGIESTLTMLGHKLKNVTVVRLGSLIEPFPGSRRTGVN